MAHTYDWPTIRSLFQSGRSAYALAKLPGYPSKQAILKRARREGWQATGQATDEVSEVAESLPSSVGAFTPQQARALQVLGDGGTFGLAAAAAGVSRQTLLDWRTSNLAYADACQTARAAHRLRLVKHIDKAAERDWKAAAWRLERDEDTREDFAPAPKAGNGGLTVVLNIDRTQVSVGDDGRTLNISPQPATIEMPAITVKHDEGMKA